LYNSLKIIAKQFLLLDDIDFLRTRIYVLEAVKKKIPIPEDQLISRLQAKEEKAFELLYDYYADSLLGIISRIVKEQEEAENLLQDTIIKIWLHIDQYSASKGRLFTWMINIARHTAINHLRSHQNQKISSIQNQEAGVYSEAVSVDPVEMNHIGIRETVQQLDKKLKDVIDLIYYLGYTQQEVADRLGMPLGTVKTRTRTALLQMRELLKED
jgi:RNA polymerase sigma factor (sigma-70 family)